MRSRLLPSSLPLIRKWITPGRNQRGGSVVGTTTNCLGTKAPIRHLWGVHSYSTRPHQPQRRGKRIALRPVDIQKKKDGGGRRNRHHRHQQHIPTYVYLAGGIPIVGGLLLYVRFRDFAPMTGRRRWLATSPEYEKNMGDENYRQLLAQYRSKILPRQHPTTIAIERAGKRIFLATRKFANEYGLDDSFDTRNVTFTVVDSNEANAFVLPGNHVFFLTGMFKYAKTEDEIGCILGHEMAHNLARHHGEKISGSLVVSIIAALSLMIDPSGNFLTVFLPAAKLLGELPNSRHQETEADRIGMFLAAEACYDPKALSHVFRRMDRAGKGGIDKNPADKPPEFLSTHPSDESRIKDMQKWLSEDQKIFDAYDGERCRVFREQLDRATSSRSVRHSHTRDDGRPCLEQL